MRVLVTGARGQVGQALAATRLADADCRFLSRGELDIRDALRVRQVISEFKPDVVINAAAYTAVDKAESDEEEARAINAHGARALAEAIKGTRCRLLHVSTDFVFDGDRATPYGPDMPTAPLNVYGKTKLEGERLALEIGAQALVLRTAWVYAGWGKNFLLTMLRLMAERGVVRVVDDQLGTPTSAESVATTLWAFASRPELKGIFHWTDAGVASWYDFAVAIAEEAAAAGLLSKEAAVIPIATADYPTAARRPSYSVLDKRSTMLALGLVPSHWRVNLRSVIKGMSRHG